jgi:hypothetical protein
MHGGSTIQKISLEIDRSRKSGCLRSFVSVLAAQRGCRASSRRSGLPYGDLLLLVLRLASSQSLLCPRYWRRGRTSAA